MGAGHVLAMPLYSASYAISSQSADLRRRCLAQFRPCSVQAALTLGTVYAVILLTTIVLVVIEARSIRNWECRADPTASASRLHRTHAPG